jgi:hypothetical protein
MNAHQVRTLDEIFAQIVKQRRGNLVRRGGAMSRDFEISFSSGDVEVLAGVETAFLAEPSLFVFVRHGGKPQTLPATQAHAPDVDADLVKRDGQREARHRLSDSRLLLPSWSDDNQLPARPVPGFSFSLRGPYTFSWLRWLLGTRHLWTDKRRPGWFHAETDARTQLKSLLGAILGEPAALLCAGDPQPLVSVALTSRIYRVRRVPLLWEVEAVDGFVTQSLKLLQAGLRTSSSRAPVPHEPGLRLLSALFDTGVGSRCGVCGEAVVQNAVNCSQCLTPHHSDCWDYSGGCSIYACGSTTKV